MDFIGTIKLVNYLRSEAKDGKIHSSVTSKAVFDDDVYMKPVLEDDVLLYNIDDLDEEPVPEVTGASATEVEELRERLERLQAQFADYREQVQRSLENQLAKDESALQVMDGTSPSTSRPSEPANYEAKEKEYFDSYSYNCLCTFCYVESPADYA